MAFRKTDGVPLRAILYKPKNFDPSKKYPLVVYIYERLSDGLHTFVDPSPSHRLDAALYASNGYLGYPGESAMKCVIAAVQRFVDRGVVNEKRIGIEFFLALRRLDKEVYSSTTTATRMACANERTSGIVRSECSSSSATS